MEPIGSRTLSLSLARRPVWWQVELVGECTDPACTPIAVHMRLRALSFG